MMTSLFEIKWEAKVSVTLGSNQNGRLRVGLAWVPKVSSTNSTRFKPKISNKNS